MTGNPIASSSSVDVAGAMPVRAEADKGNADGPCASGARGCTTTLHELANSMTAVLVNAQMLDWKLPPYSRLKRPVREIERHAQRSGVLLKRLLQQFEQGPTEERESCRQIPSLDGTLAAAPAREAQKEELTSLCDPCTSAVFPKEERLS